MLWLRSFRNGVAKCMYNGFLGLEGMRRFVKVLSDPRCRSC